MIDCGGTARCGVYPRKRIPTINLTPVGQSGPLAQYITEDIYVSGVTTKSFSYADGSQPATVAGGASASAAAAPKPAPAPVPQGGGGLVGFITAIGRVMGRAVNIFFNAGRRTIDQVIRNVLPFMAFVTMLIGIILYTGIGDNARGADGTARQQHRRPRHPVGDLRLPFLSPILGPGAVIAQVNGVAINGPQIANGTIAPRWPCRRCLPTTPRSAATSCRSAWRSAKPSRIPSKSACRRFS